MTKSVASRTLTKIPDWMGRHCTFPQSYPEIPYAAKHTQFDLRFCQTIYATVMELVEFSTFHPIHGLLNFEKKYEHPNHVEPQTYRCFFGYCCRDCQEIFLVPDTVHDGNSLVRAMRHECVASKQNDRTTGGQTK